VKKWEYLLVADVTEDAAVNLPKFVNQINEHAKEGFRICQLIWWSRTDPPNVLMEREIPEPPTDKEIDKLAESLADDCKKRDDDDSEHPTDYGGFD